MMSIIDTIRAHVAADDIEEAVMIVYRTVDDCLWSGDFGSIRALLHEMAGTPLPLVVLLSGLVATIPEAAKAGEEREQLYRVTWDAAGNRAPDVLRGLARDGT